MSTVSRTPLASLTASLTSPCGGQQPAAAHDVVPAGANPSTAGSVSGPRCTTPQTQLGDMTNTVLQHHSTTRDDAASPANFKHRCSTTIPGYAGAGTLNWRAVSKPYSIHCAASCCCCLACSSVTTWSCLLAAGHPLLETASWEPTVERMLSVVRQGI